MISDYIQHKRDCKRKQTERADKIANLPLAYRTPISSSDRTVLGKPIQDLVHEVHKGITSPIDILRTYGKVSIKAQEKTNCVTEILFPEAEEWIKNGVNLQGPLAGIPVSLKDTVVVGGFDATVGFSTFAGKPFAKDGAIVRLLKDAGAVPFVKTNIPVTLLSFESTNDVWGRATNPHNNKYSPGGSTGGEAALLAFGGSRIGIGSDVAGSVRVPAHFSGCYTIRCSTGRWPKMGVNTSMPGQDGCPTIYSPMARTLNDLTYFARSIIQMEPWKYDHSVHPLAWRSELEDEWKNKPKLRIGVLRDDGVVTPSPACARALQETVSALEAAGHTVFDVSPPSPYEGLLIASTILTADGCRTFASFFRSGEWVDSGAKQLYKYIRLPAPIRWLHSKWVRYVQRDPIWAGLLEGWFERSSFEHWKLTARREAYKARWHDWWTDEAGIDIMLTPPNATPAVPHDGMHDAVSSCGYTFLFNIIDYTTGIIPVTHVDAKRDQLPPSFNIKKLNGVARGAYKHYDATAMEGLPVGVQIVAQRLQEEKVLAVMETVENALATHGEKYQLLEVD